MTIADYIRQRTVEATAFECKVISSIMGGEFAAADLRYASDHTCKECRRKLTILDVFLTGFVFHGLDFIRNDVHCDAPKLRIFDHPFAVNCLNCGTVNFY